MMKYVRWINASNLLILTLVIISITLWFLSKTSFVLLRYTPWLFIAQASGMIAITLISFNFLLATRSLIFRRIFGNLEEVYKIHKWVGILGLSFAIFHFLSFLFHSISYPTLFSFYFVPNDYWSLNFARVGLLLFILLVALTFVKSIPYHIWKWSHSFMGLAFILVFLHVYFVKSDVAKMGLLRAWTMGVMLVGLLAFIYIRIIYPFLGSRHLYIVKEVNALKGRVYQIKMEALAKPIDYQPAQYIFVSFLSKEVGSESHPFTLSSSFKDGRIEISPKELGDFTRKLKHLKVGTKVKVWGPYGTFSDEFLKDESEQIWIAGGIGVTPFLSMLSHQSSFPKKQKKWMFYCCRNPEDATFEAFLREETKKLGIDFIQHFSDTQGFVGLDFIKSYVPDFHNKKVLICGPTLMKSFILDALIEDGVDLSDIIQEDFNLR